MSSTRDIRDFYKTSNNKIPPFLTSASGSLNRAEQNGICVREVQYKVPLVYFCENICKQLEEEKENDKKQNIVTVIAKKGRPNLETLAKVRDAITKTRLTGGVISRKMVIAIGNGVIKANSPSSLKKYGGHIELTDGWARHVLESMKRTKGKGTTGKVEPSQQFLDEEKLTFQRNISTINEDHDIPKDLILNLDQTPLSYVSPGKYTLNPKGAKTVPIKGVDDKRQITATFSISMTGSFLPIQLIYEGPIQPIQLISS